MAKSVAFVKVITLVTICMLAKSTAEGKELTCNDVRNDLLPCQSYIGCDDVMTEECCDGLQALLNAAETKADCQTACSCFKFMAKNLSDEQLKRLAKIPIACGANLSFNISRDEDCSKVSNC